ncbi:hypothetical protein [Actinomadura sp. DC4]|uniref:hypothetical protein n=1 Tax=Actinomadura sp. DC4 TaxID=3055069 RepID=UPI0025AF4693|nr:hypothetical protein [Actinomadura sp. DC4]MDN3356097.1 hypothetical protein [Actinomadura sp. DC4]
MTVRAKFYCSTVEQASDKPVETSHYVDGKLQPSGEFTWPRTYRFNAQYDMSVPEDQRYAKASPSGELRIQVDNPAVSFEPGKAYYLDFTPVEDTPKE